MSDGTNGPFAESSVASSDKGADHGFVLLVLIVANPESFDDLVTGLLDIGVSATIVQSKGLMAFLREEMPVFSGLAAMMPDVTGSRIAFSVTGSDLAEQVMRFIEEEFEDTQRPIGLAVGINRVVGLRR